MYLPSLFDTFFDGMMYPTASAAKKKVNFETEMKTDVIEKENGYEFAIDLPGYNKEDLKASLKEGYLTISATKEEKNEEKDEDGRYIHRERFYGSTSRRFFVGKEVTEEDIVAKFENGVLRLDIPKKQPVPKEPENKYIAIQ